MSFRTKCHAILKYRPDLAIISECENVKKLKLGELIPEPTDFFWHGENENKGIGIFSFSDFKFQKFRNFNPKFRYIIPLKVKGNRDFNLFAVWAMNSKEEPRERYIGQVWLAINYYKRQLNQTSILMGDFNSNTIWDNDAPAKVGNHSDVTRFLSRKKINSLYHTQTSQDHGKETRHTLFLHRSKQKPFHIDYCFASNSLTNKGYNVTIGHYDDWFEFSDHVPIIADITI